MATGTIDGRIIEFCWRIPQFGALNKNVGEGIVSPNIDLGGECWYLKCYPMGREESCRNIVSLFLRYGSSREVKASFKLMLVQRGGGVKEVGSEDDFLFTASSGRGRVRALSRDEALNNTIDGDLLFLATITTGRPRPIDPPSSLTSDLANLLQLGSYSDLIIQVSGEEHKVHKPILAARSKYFKRLLESGMEEAIQGRITITEFRKETVQAMLAYLYHDKLPDDQVAEELVLAADKYNLVPLKKFCSSLLLRNIRIDNVCNMLSIANCLNLRELKEVSCDFISRNWNSVILTEDFKRLFTTNYKLATEVLLKGQRPTRRKRNRR